MNFFFFNSRIGNNDNDHDRGDDVKQNSRRQMRINWKAMNSIKKREDFLKRDFRLDNESGSSFLSALHTIRNKNVCVFLFFY